MLLVPRSASDQTLQEDLKFPECAVMWCLNVAFLLLCRVCQSQEASLMREEGIESLWRCISNPTAAWTSELEGSFDVVQSPLRSSLEGGWG